MHTEVIVFHKNKTIVLNLKRPLTKLKQLIQTITFTAYALYFMKLFPDQIFNTLSLNQSDQLLN